MKILLNKSVLSFFVFFSFLFHSSAQKKLVLWYDKPSKAWTDAVPLGNGRLGAMVYGVPQSDTIQINEDTFWSGSPYQNINSNAKKSLKQIQNYLQDENFIEAQKLALSDIIADRKTTSHGQVYQSIGNLVLSVPNHEKYTNFYRDLDLKTAIATTKYTVNGVNFQREVFTSFTGPLKTNMVKVTSSVPANQNQLLVVNGQCAREKEENIINLLHFNTQIKVEAKGGTQSKEGESISVKNADEAFIYISEATNFKNYKDISADAEKRAKDYLKAFSKSYQKAKEDHIAFYQKQFNRVQLDLGNSPQINKPTDQRIAEFSKTEDPDLVSTYFQFGRYLLIASSQPGSQPANLQGIWNP